MSVIEKHQPVVCPHVSNMEESLAFLVRSYSFIRRSCPPMDFVSLEKTFRFLARQISMLLTFSHPFLLLPSDIPGEFRPGLFEPAPTTNTNIEFPSITPLLQYSNTPSKRGPANANRANKGTGNFQESAPLTHSPYSPIFTNKGTGNFPVTATGTTGVVGAVGGAGGASPLPLPVPSIPLARKKGDRQFPEFPGLHPAILKLNKSFSGVQGRFFQKEPLAPGGKKNNTKKGTGHFPAAGTTGGAGGASPLPLPVPSIPLPYLPYSPIFTNKGTGNFQVPVHFLNNVIRPLLLRVYSQSMDVSDGKFPGSGSAFETAKTVENIKMTLENSPASRWVDIVSPSLISLAVGSRYVQTRLNPLTLRSSINNSINIYPGTPAVTTGIDDGTPDRKAGITGLSVTDVKGSIENREVLKAPAFISPWLSSLAVGSRYVQNRQNRVTNVQSQTVHGESVRFDVRFPKQEEWQIHWHKEELWFLNNLLQGIAERGLSTAVVAEKMYKARPPGSETHNSVAAVNYSFKAVNDSFREREGQQKVTNTFNVTVNTPLPEAGDNHSLQDLEEKLTEILRDEARRYGIKV